MTRDDARTLFASSGIRIEDLNAEKLSDLRKRIDGKMKESELISGTFRTVSRLSKAGGSVSIRCKSRYFDDREAVTFNPDGFIGFAGWADDTNIKPILEAFNEWVQDMTAELEKDQYILMTAVDESGAIANISVDNSIVTVSVAEPKPNTNGERITSDVAEYRGDPKSAVEDFFRRIKSTGMPGVLDTAEVRIHAKEPLDFCNKITEEIHEDIPEMDEDDSRDDDFENHPLSELREAMVEACPEYSGEEPAGP